MFQFSTLDSFFPYDEDGFPVELVEVVAFCLLVSRFVETRARREPVALHKVGETGIVGHALSVQTYRSYQN